MSTASKSAKVIIEKHKKLLVSKPEKSVSKPEKSVSKPEKSVSKPEKSVSKPEKSVIYTDTDTESVASSKKTREPSAYNLFMKIELPKIKAESVADCKKLTRKEIMGVLSERWANHKKFI